MRLRLGEAQHELRPFSSRACAYHPLTSLQVPGYPLSHTLLLFLWKHNCMPVLPNSVQIYCGGVDTTPSIDRWTHVVHSIYRQLDSLIWARNKDPLFLLLSCTSMRREPGRTLPYYRCGTAKSIFLPKVCYCYRLPTNQLPSQHYYFDIARGALGLFPLPCPP
jgi:hypothetical protein